MRRDLAKSREAAGLFYRHTRQAADDSGFPVVEVNGADQRGDRFGSRLSNALADVFSRGYRQVIVVGSDCPTLHEVDWQGVADELEEGHPVLGPTAEGDGTYLIGLHRDHFDPESFAALPWKSPVLLQALNRYLGNVAGSRPVRLDRREDVNGHSELLAILESTEHLSGALIVRLRAVLGRVQYAEWVQSEGASPHLPGHPSRGPPSAKARSTFAARLD